MPTTKSRLSAIYDKIKDTPRPDVALRIYELEIALEATFKVTTRSLRDDISTRVRDAVRRIMKSDHDFADREYLEQFLERA